MSASKAEKLAGLLPRIHTLKPNALEAELLSGVPVVDRDSARRAARRLIDLGVKPETAAEDACRMEHVISAESFKCLKKHLKKEHPNVDLKKKK